jgi:peptidyl-prolyl cis-trans isomerase B (cyclophilin B)
VLAAVLGSALAPGLAADETAVPVGSGLVLDGALSEPAWGSAASVPAGAVKVPARRGSEGGAPDGKIEIVPTVRLLVTPGELWIGVEIPEDVGIGTGLKGMVAPPSTASAADAFSFAFMPMDLRSARWTARGPRGTGRAVYRVRGALSLADPATSRMEVAIPLADLELPSPDAPLRLALAIGTRTPDTISWAPAGASFQGPATWALLAAPSGGWGTAPAVDAAPLAAEDAADERRMAAWRKHLEGRQRGLPSGTPEQRIAAAQAILLDPLDEVLAARPDLALAHYLKGDILRQLGRPEEALAEARRALAVTPGLREAKFLHLTAFAAAFTEKRPGEPSDYAGAVARLDEAAKTAADAYEKDGIDLARGSLLHKRGDFAEAIALLEPLVERYPFHPEPAGMLQMARKFAGYWPTEQGFRTRDQQKGDLPRVRIATTKGPIVVELFEEDAPNSVKNFVWLASQGFYDGSLFHRHVPFFMSQGGDPYSRDAATRGRAGIGGPCYTIATEVTGRKPFRGVLAMARFHRPDTEGSQFFLTTGTAAHLDGEYTVLGRVVEGLEVLDSLVQDDRMDKVEVLRTRPGVEYRPVTTTGAPAPEPKACGPSGR